MPVQSTQMKNKSKLVVDREHKDHLGFGHLSQISKPDDSKLGSLSATGQQRFHRAIQEAVWRSPPFSSDRNGPKGIEAPNSDASGLVG